MKKKRCICPKYFPLTVAWVSSRDEYGFGENEGINPIFSPSCSHILNNSPSLQQICIMIWVEFVIKPYY